MFEEIKGFNNKFITKKIKKYKPSPDQLNETDAWIRSNGGNFSNKFSVFNQINKNNINNLKLEFKIDLNNKIFKKSWMKMLKQIQFFMMDYCIL